MFLLQTKLFCVATRQSIPIYCCKAFKRFIKIFMCENVFFFLVEEGGYAMLPEGEAKKEDLS